MKGEYQMKNINIAHELNLRDIPYIEQEPLKNRTTFSIGGKCDFFVSPKTLEQIEQFLPFCKDNEIPIFVLGRGSNLLVSDDGFKGIVLSTQNLKEISLLPDGNVLCQSGASLSRLCKFALENSLSGLEFAYGIPGSVGGAIYMNAGAYGGEISDVIVSAEAIDFDGNRIIYEKDKLELGYRTSRFQNENSIITSGIFKLKHGNPSEIKEKMDEFYRRRKEKQPLEYPSAGSTFKRPVGGYASALIEQCGLKGLTVGGAQVSEKHSGFVINIGGATCEDVNKLVSKIKKEVFDKTGILLEQEIKYVG